MRFRGIDGESHPVADFAAINYHLRAADGGVNTTLQVDICLGTHRFDDVSDGLAQNNLVTGIK